MSEANVFGMVPPGMNCPRCDQYTNRIVVDKGVQIPLICTHCLDDIEVRSAMGELMVWNSDDLPVKGA